MKHCAWLIFAFVLIGSTVEAHHSGAQYDQKIRVNISGVVTKMEWTNPHARLYVEANDEHGTTAKWEFELPSVNRLLRLGWTRHALNPGDHVTVTGARARSFAYIAAATNVISAGGKKLFVGSPGDPR